MKRTVKKRELQKKPGHDDISAHCQWMGSYPKTMITKLPVNTGRDEGLSHGVELELLTSSLS